MPEPRRAVPLLPVKSSASLRAAAEKAVRAVVCAEGHPAVDGPSTTPSLKVGVDMPAFDGESVVGARRLYTCTGGGST